MLKFPLMILLAIGARTSFAFTVNSPYSQITSHAQLKSSLFATVEGTKELVAPNDIPSDDMSSLFETYVQKTYG